MDVEGFADLLTRAGVDVTALEIAEALWLGQYATTAASPDLSESVPEPPPAAVGPAAPERTGPVPLHLPLAPAAERATAASPASTADNWMPVPVPASTALPGKLALLRALRSLKVRVPDPLHRMLDETATAEATANAGALFPVLKARRERSLSLALVVDTGPAMVIWDKLESEIADLLWQLGAFRDLQRWRLHTALDGLPRLSRIGQGTTAHASHDPAELIDPAGRRLIAVLTDGAGAAWYSGAMSGLLRRWGEAGPIVLLQPLPQQLWARTALGPVHGKLTARRRTAPNAELTFTPRSWRGPRTVTPASDARPVPVPMLQIGPDWLRGWARFVTGAAGADLDCAVTLASSRAGPLALPRARLEAEPVSADVRVRHFAEQASPEALRLASCLAAVPLSLPVMRLVQQAMLPGTGPSLLAEVVLGGLILTRGVADEHASRQQRWRYEFAPGVRDVLLSGLGRHEAHRVLTTVSHDLAARFGRGAIEFTAVAALPGSAFPGSAPSGPAPSGLTAVYMTNQPFAEIATHVLERITGRFTTPAGAVTGRASESDGRSESDGPSGSAEPTADRDERLTVTIRRYQRTGRVADTDSAIAELRRVISAEPPRAVAWLPELAAALRSRYLALGEESDLDEAVLALRQVVAAQDAGTMSAAYEQLATTLALRHARTGSPADLTEAVAAARTAVGTGGASRAAITLGELLARRARAGGASADLDQAIAWFRNAIDDQALSGEQRAHALTELSVTLRERARSSHPSADLDESVTAIRLAIELTPRGVERPAMTEWELARQHGELGAALLDRARDAPVGTPGADLRAAADSYRTAVDLLLPLGVSPRLPGYLTGLGQALTGLADADGDGLALGEAISALRRALAETPPEDQALPERQAALAAALITRFSFDNRPGDLDEARFRLDEILARHFTPEPSTNDKLTARFLLARAHAAEGQDNQARELLTELLPNLPPEHPDYRAARELKEALCRLARRVPCRPGCPWPNCRHPVKYRGGSRSARASAPSPA
jgi:tetratricopeptide (TPR) repeat protein